MVENSKFTLIVVASSNPIISLGGCITAVSEPEMLINGFNDLHANSWEVVWLLHFIQSVHNLILSSFQFS
jgi:hypothetical protein